MVGVQKKRCNLGVISLKRAVETMGVDDIIVDTANAGKRRSLVFKGEPVLRGQQSAQCNRKSPFEHHSNNHYRQNPPVTAKTHGQKA